MTTPTQPTPGELPASVRQAIRKAVSEGVFQADVQAGMFTTDAEAQKSLIPPLVCTALSPLWPRPAPSVQAAAVKIDVRDIVHEELRDDDLIRGYRLPTVDRIVDRIADLFARHLAALGADGERLTAYIECLEECCGSATLKEAQDMLARRSARATPKAGNFPDSTDESSDAVTGAGDK